MQTALEEGVTAVPRQKAGRREGRYRGDSNQAWKKECESRAKEKKQSEQGHRCEKRSQV